VISCTIRTLVASFLDKGAFTTDENGEYWFYSVKPKFYPIPDDGPVGKLLTVLGRHPNRPAHIHFIVTAPGFEAVTTHIFAPDCPYLGEDPVFGVKQSLVAEFRKIDAPTDKASAGADGANWEVEWNFILSPLP
jgi:hydroxyquinol 1,2-dioxygenase